MLAWLMRLALPAACVVLVANAGAFAQGVQPNCVPGMGLAGWPGNPATSMCGNATQCRSATNAVTIDQQRVATASGDAKNFAQKQLAQAQQEQQEMCGTHSALYWHCMTYHGAPDNKACMAGDEDAARRFQGGNPSPGDRSKYGGK